MVLNDLIPLCFSLNDKPNVIFVLCYVPLSFFFFKYQTMRELYFETEQRFIGTENGSHEMGESETIFQ